MNRSYRSVWNESLGAWVATSEVTKAKGKHSRQGRTAQEGNDHVAIQPFEPAPAPSGIARAVVAMVLGSVGLLGGAMAQTGPPPPPSSNIYLGNGAYSDSQGSICTPANGVIDVNAGDPPPLAAGYACVVAAPNGGYAVINVGVNQDNGAPDFAALADAATKIGANSLMMGGATQTGAQAVALGFNAAAAGTNAVAVGPMSNAMGVGSTAVGFNAQVVQEVTGANGSGDPSAAVVDGGTALGLGSRVDALAQSGNKALAARSMALNGAIVKAEALQSDAGVEGSLAMGVGATVQAISNQPYSPSVSDTPVASASHAIAMGTGATVSADNSNLNGRVVALADNAVVIGTNAKAVTNGQIDNVSNSVAIGTNSYINGDASIAIGFGAGEGGGTDTAYQTGDNVALGRSAGSQVNGATNLGVGSLAGVNVAGDKNTAMGAGAGNSVTGDRNLALGYQAGSVVQGLSSSGPVATDNLAVGSYAGNNVTGNDNIGVGRAAGSNTTGESNVALGGGAGYEVRGDMNAALGSGAGAYVTGLGNTSTGYGAGQQVTGDYNTSNGYRAGEFSTGSGNVSMGLAAGSSSTGNGNVSLGLGAGAGNANDAVRIGSAAGTTAAGMQALQITDPSGSSAATAIYARMDQLLKPMGASYTARQINEGLSDGTFVTDGATGEITKASDGSVVLSGANAQLLQQQMMTLGSGDRSISIGRESLAAGTDSIANGTGAYAARANAIAVGTASQALGVGSIAIGRNAIATGSVALGDAAQAGNGGTAIGDGAVGTYMNGATTAGTVAGTALGKNAQADVSGATALGTGAQATAANSVALGSSSVASGTTLTQAAYAPGGAAVSGVNPAGEVSVGGAGAERRITNLAAGATDTDAVNVSQLKASQAAVTTHYYSVQSAGAGTPNYNNDGAQAAGSMAAGVGAEVSAKGNNSTAVGLSSKVIDAENSVAMGYRNTGRCCITPV